MHVIRQFNSYLKIVESGKKESQDGEVNFSGTKFEADIVNVCDSGSEIKFVG